jgi:ribonuclease D
MNRLFQKPLACYHPSPMANVDLIESERALETYAADLRSRGIGRIALDLEGDQGRFRYRNAISIIQCFDGERAAVIDVLNIGNAPALKAFLTSDGIVKVMFACRNDMFMAQNVLGYSIERVRDIAIAQKLLGMRVDLAGYIGIEKERKDSFQRANWLKRPIRSDFLDYAIRDVDRLLEIEERLAAELKARNKFDDYVRSSETISRNNYQVDIYEQYKEKLPGFRGLDPTEKRLAAIVWAFRELMGEHFDCPVGYMLPKAAVVDIITNGDDIITNLEREMNRGRKRENEVSRELILRLYRRAEEIADT